MYLNVPLRSWLLRAEDGSRTALFLLTACGLLFFNPLPVFSQDNSSAGPPKFLGAKSCSSSSCHGGAGNNKDQYVVWSKYDYHHARPFATLETARAERIAEVLKLGDPARSTACTVCHAPLQTLSREQMARPLAAAEGVTCESCHGPAENWLRGHTRHDWTHENRVQSGMRDLRNLYVRANTCVACHQNLERNIRQAGHPELIFELDGQAVTQPRHWPVALDKPGPQIWIVGQSIALRELSWQLLGEKTHEPDTVASWAALVWLLQSVKATNSDGSVASQQRLEPTKERLEEMRGWSDQLGKESASSLWSAESTRKCLALLTKAGDTFRNQTIPVPILARRAERLVLALDRLVTGLGDSDAPPATSPALERLFDDVQSLPDFDPRQFANDLQKFQATLPGNNDSK